MPVGNWQTHLIPGCLLQISHYTVTADDDEMIIFRMFVVRFQFTILNRDSLPVSNILIWIICGVSSVLPVGITMSKKSTGMQYL